MNRARALRELSQALRGAAPQHLDWGGVLALANETLVTPALSHLAGDDHTPLEVAKFLTDVARRNADRNASLMRTLADAATALNSVAIVPIVMKGVATWFDADGLTPDAGARRITSDVDLLAPPGDLQRAARALRDAGFEVLEDNSNQAHHPVIVLGRTSDAGSIDLHANAPGPPGITELQHLSDLSVTVAHAGYRVKTPPPELQILIMALHDQLLDGRFWRGGFELRHLIDIAALSARRSGVDWGRLVEIADRHGIRILVETQLRAAKEFAGANIPVTVITTFAARLHCWRQRIQFVHPVVNAPFHLAGLNQNVWRRLASRPVTESNPPPHREEPR